MPTLKTKITATDALIGIWTVALATFIVATLYFARELLIPLALSALLTFLLSPLSRASSGGSVASRRCCWSWR